VAHAARLHAQHEYVCDSVPVRTAYRCRAYPGPAQQQALARTFGCVRVVWNRTLAARHARWHAEAKGTSYAATDRALTEMKKDPSLAFLNEVSSVAKVARAHRKVRNARRDFLHRASTRCERYGRKLIVIDRWYPSSKTCSACGHLIAELSLSARRWTCPACRAQHDRDVNAAKNILAAGLAVALDSQGHACGAGVRNPGSSWVRSAMKQEPQPVTVGISVLQLQAGSSQG
jgi:transposase